MKKKLLFIGNSHIGSLKSGFEYIDKSVLTNYELSFCGVRRNHFYKHKLIGDILEFDKSVTRFNFNLQEHIQLYDYDYCICVFNISPLARLKHKNYSFYSENLLKRYIKKLYWLKTANEDCHDLILSIYKLIPQKFIFLGAPLVCQFNKKLWHDEAFYINQISSIRDICDKYFSNLNGPKILLPPENLLNDNGIYTREAYMKGAINADGEANVNPNNVNHMNPEYGKAIILELLKKIR